MSSTYLLIALDKHNGDGSPPSSPVIVIPLLLHLHLNIILNKRTMPGNFQTKQLSVRNRTAGLSMEKYYHIRTSVLHRVEDLQNNRLRSKQPCL